MGADGDLILQQAAGPGATQSFASMSYPYGFEQSVNGGGTDRQQLASGFLASQRLVNGLIVRQPQWNGGFEFL